MEITVRAEVRSRAGKGPARQARARGFVPGVLYGPAIDATPLLVERKALTHALHTEAGANVLINLELDARGRYLAMLREVQRHPVRGELLHVDFVNVARDVTIHADVPVHLVGESHGVKEGGVIEHHLWEVKVSALPADVPSAFEVDVTPLGIGEHLRAGDIVPPEGVEILTPPEEIVVSVVEPQVLRVEEVAPTEVPAAEEGAAPEAGEA